MPLQKVNSVESLSGRFFYGTWCLFSGCSGNNIFSLVGGSNAKGEALPLTVGRFSLSEQVMERDNT